MATTAESLFALVVSDHTAAFPNSVEVVRENKQTGVPPHNPPKEYLRALCFGLYSGVTQLKIYDLGSGTANVTGVVTPPETKFTLPAIPAAKALFVVSQGWLGKEGSKAADSTIVSPLTRLSAMAGIVMNSPNPALGTGVGVISPLSNPTLLADAKTKLTVELLSAFQSSGFFSKDDNPGIPYGSAPLNEVISAAIPAYAEAYATAIASIVAAVGYVGPVGSTTPVSGIINSGFIV